VKLTAISNLEGNVRRSGEIIGVLAKYGLADQAQAGDTRGFQQKLNGFRRRY